MSIKLPKKIAMLDLELTGVLPKVDDILEVAMLKCDLDESTLTYKVSDKPLHFYLATEAVPTRKFHFEHLSNVFNKCHTEGISLDEAKNRIDAFLGRTERRWPCGDCVTTDLMFLYQKDLMAHNYYDENDVEVFGNLDYRPFEMKPLKVLAQTKGWEKPKDSLKEHEAINDCFNQLYELNDCLKFLMKS